MSEGARHCKIASTSRNIWLIVVKDETWSCLPIYAFALERVRLGKPKLFRPIFVRIGQRSSFYIASFC